MRFYKVNGETVDFEYGPPQDSVIRTASALIDARKNVRKYQQYLEDSAGERRVALDEPARGVRVSTVFLGVDLANGQDNVPHLYETRVFGGRLEGLNWTAPDASIAQRLHDDAVAKVREAEGLTAIDEIKRKRKNSSWAF